MNRAHLFVSVMFLGVAACGPDLQASCQEAVDAQIACINEAYGEDAAGAEAITAAYDGYCDPYVDTKGEAADAAADLFQCQADATNAADCSTVEGLSDLNTAVAACATAGA